MFAYFTSTIHRRLAQGNRALQRKIPAFVSITLLFVPTVVFAQALPVNYDRLSFFEKPNAWEVPGGTMFVNIALDQTYTYDAEAEKSRHQTEALTRIRYEGQLENTMRVGVEYFSHYFRTGNLRYSDQVQLFVADDWGTVSIGNVSLAVRQDTRRRRGIGHAELLFDDFYSGLDQDALYYRFNHRAYTASAVVDRQGGGEIGVRYQRPVGDAVYAYALRARKGDTTDRDPTDGVPNPIQLGRDPAKGYGIGGTFQYTYGSWDIGWQGGYEYLDLKRKEDKNQRVFNSLGVHYKTGIVTTSLEGLIGDYDGNRELSAALGVEIEVARGTLLQFGYNWSDYLNLRTSQAFTTLCYQF